MDGKMVIIAYTNHSGETSIRTITPLELYWGSTKWHPQKQWLLRANDHGKEAERTFAWKDIHFNRPS